MCLVEKIMDFDAIEISSVESSETFGSFDNIEQIVSGICNLTTSPISNHSLTDLLSSIDVERNVVLNSPNNSLTKSDDINNTVAPVLNKGLDDQLTDEIVVKKSEQQRANSTYAPNFDMFDSLSDDDISTILSPNLSPK